MPAVLDETCLLADRAAETFGLAPPERSSVIYTTLLRFLGCTADASNAAVLAGGDEIGFNAAMAPVVMADDREAVLHLLRHLGEDLPLRRRVGRIAAALSDPSGKAWSLSSHCEVGARLATRMGLPGNVVRGVAHGYERWDGKGLPAGLAGDEIRLATRVAVVARDVDVAYARAGFDEVRRVLEHRRGRAYDPLVADAFVAGGDSWLDELGALDPRDAVLDAEPAPVVEVDDSQLNDVLAAFADFADFADLRMPSYQINQDDIAPSTSRHSSSPASPVNRALRTAAHTFASRLPDARYLELDCGHVTYAEQPDQFARAVAAYASEAALSSPTQPA